jgi:PKD repeat protein
VDIQTGPEGDIYYLSIFSGEVRHIRYASGNQSPVAVALATPSAGLTPLTVNFSSAGSFDPDAGQAITYDWDFGDGSAHSTEANPTHDYTVNGVYQATLTVTDPLALWGQDTVTITVGLPPTYDCRTGRRVAFRRGDTITFSGTGSDPGDLSLPPAGCLGR